MGIEPTASVWKTEVLPLYDRRFSLLFLSLHYQMPLGQESEASITLFLIKKEVLTGVFPFMAYE
jgi:hypothetical protein